MSTRCFRAVVFYAILLIILLTGCSKKKQAETSHAGINAGSPLELFQQGGLFGYRNDLGIAVIKPQYTEAGSFSWGLARVKPSVKGGWGYIDESGKLVIPTRYEAASDFIDGMAIVLSKGQFTYIGPDAGSLGVFGEESVPKTLEPGDTLYVVHPNELIARSTGNLSAAPVVQVPTGQPVVLVHDPLAARSDNYEGLRGTWRLVRYQKKTAYLFDLYLSRFPLVVEHQPVERYEVIGSSLKDETRAVYTLTTFASGGHAIVREGPNWTENDEIVPDATVDQVIARLKLYPSGDLGSLLTFYTGASQRLTTQEGDTVITSVRRDDKGFLDNVVLSKRSEGFSFDATFSRHGSNAVEILTTATTPPSDNESTTLNQF